jgi:hypothetical protein
MRALFAEEREGLILGQGLHKGIVNNKASILRIAFISFISICMNNHSSSNFFGFPLGGHPPESRQANQCQKSYFIVLQEAQDG